MEFPVLQFVPTTSYCVTRSVNQGFRFCYTMDQAIQARIQVKKLLEIFLKQMFPDSPYKGKKVQLFWAAAVPEYMKSHTVW